MTKTKQAKFKEIRQQLEDIAKLKPKIDDKIDDDEMTKKIFKKVGVKELDRRKKLLFDKKETKERFKINFGILGRSKLKKDPLHSYIVTMFFPNGVLKTWVVKTKKDYFNIKNSHYYLDYEESYFDISLNQFHMFFHYTFPVPINREIQKVLPSEFEGHSIEKMTDEELKQIESYFTITPTSLKGFIQQNFVGRLVKQKDTNMMWIWIVIVIGIVILIAIAVKMFSGGAG